MRRQARASAPAPAAAPAVKVAACGPAAPAMRSKLVETSQWVRGMSQRNSTAQRLVFAAQHARVPAGKTRFNANVNSRKRPLAVPALWGETTASLATREESARGPKSALAQVYTSQALAKSVCKRCAHAFSRDASARSSTLQ